MALFTPLLGELSGKIAGNVWSHNRGGSYVRAWAIPTNPNTALQQVIRTAMANLVVAWLNDLSVAQRAAWTTYGANVAMTNRLGETIFLTGQNHFIRSNISRVQAGLAVVEDGPTIFNLGEFAAISFTAAVPQPLSVTFDDTEAWVAEDGSAMLLQQSPAQNQTINFFKSPFRTIGSIFGNFASPRSSPQPKTSFFNMALGDRIFLRARITRIDGRLSATQIVFHDIT